ncbi:MAG: hypothetical protein CM15mP102_21810 [Flavobacteriales bacterium]|nr:MAG: hypothetical protein CM15mP102_21810 [Flavobacteriales bacterium]
MAFGLRNPWSCFFQNDSLIIPDVGNSHWEEINIIDNINNIEEPVFLDGLGLSLISMLIIQVHLLTLQHKMS